MKNKRAKNFRVPAGGEKMGPEAEGVKQSKQSFQNRTRRGDGKKKKTKTNQDSLQDFRKSILSN